jgi:hypothetical protein
MMLQTNIYTYSLGLVYALLFILQQLENKDVEIAKPTKADVCYTGSCLNSAGNIPNSYDCAKGHKHQLQISQFLVQQSRQVRL